jgi:hypothetical protein
MKLKTFESFEIDNSKVYVIGIPSGEALQVSRDGLDSLIKEKIVIYSTKYVDTGFFVFDDEDVDLVMRYVEKPLNVVQARKKAKKDIIVFTNDFDPMVTDAILGIVDDYPTIAELYIQDDCMGITFGDKLAWYMEITMNSHGGRYHLVKRYKGEVKDKYNIATDANLIDRIDHEMHH